MHEITMDVKHTLSPLAAPLIALMIALSWLSVCLLVAGTGLVVLVSLLAQSVLQTTQQIVRA